MTIPVVLLLSGCTRQAEPVGRSEQPATPVVPAIARQLPTSTQRAPTAEAGPQRQPQAGKSSLDSALALAPAGALWTSFTDWALLKQHSGFARLTSKDSKEERFKLVQWCRKYQEPLPQSGWTVSFDHFANLWSWDMTDLDWEETILTGEGAPITIIKFRDDFDLAPVLAHVTERNYRKSDYRGITIHSQDSTEADWKMDFAVLNMALLPDRKVLVLCSHITGVQAVLDTYTQQTGEPPVTQALGTLPGRLGQVPGAYIRLGSGLCPNPGPLPATLPPRAVTTARPNGPLGQVARATHAYNALAVGYRFQGDHPIGIIAMHYLQANEAEADLQTRASAAREGVSIELKRGAAYSDFLFTVDSADVEGSDMVMRVHPVDDNTNRLFYMISRWDMVFGGCP